FEALLSLAEARAVGPADLPATARATYLLAECHRRLAGGEPDAEWRAMSYFREVVDRYPLSPWPPPAPVPPGRGAAPPGAGHPPRGGGARCREGRNPNERGDPAPFAPRGSPPYSPPSRRAGSPAPRPP